MYRKLCSRTSRLQADMDTKCGEEFSCKRESGNKDPYAVAVIRRGTVVGHVPRKISAAMFSGELSNLCSFFCRIFVVLAAARGILF